MERPTLTNLELTHRHGEKVDWQTGRLAQMSIHLRTRTLKPLATLRTHFHTDVARLL